MLFLRVTNTGGACCGLRVKCTTGGAQKYAGPFNIDYRERESHARGVYPTQDTSRLGTARLKGENEADTSVIVIE